MPIDLEFVGESRCSGVVWTETRVRWAQQVLASVF